MIGSIFVEFLDFVEQKYGLDTVDKIIDTLDGKLSTDGAYTAVGNYPHGELLDMAVTLCSLDDRSMPGLVHDFAGHLMQMFRREHASYFGSSTDVFDFLLSVGNVIHADVRKLYRDARPPLVNGQLCQDGGLELRYQSHRPLAELALALTKLSGDVFGEPLAVEVIERSHDDRRIAMRARKLA